MASAGEEIMLEESSTTVADAESLEGAEQEGVRQAAAVDDETKHLKADADSGKVDNSSIPSDDRKEPAISQRSDYGRDHSLPPKVKTEVQDLADGVTKQLISEGQGDKTPSRHTTCFLHYRAWAETTMHKFDDTWQEGAPFEIVIGHEKKVLRGLAICVASMKSGETALFHVHYNLGYGEEGNFSFPNVPPQTNIIYEVALIGFEEAKEGRPRGEMMVEERIAAADRRRIDGNEFFKENKYEEAINQYEMALAYMGDEFMFQLFGKYKDMADAVKTPCHLNMAASLIKLERYAEAIGHCTVVLGENPQNSKALFRRGKARAALGQTDTAKEDFQKLKTLAPDDKAVNRELRAIAESDRELYLKQKELYKGLFKPQPQEKKVEKKKTTRDIAILHWFMSIFNFFVGLFTRGRQGKVGKSE